MLNLIHFLRRRELGDGLGSFGDGVLGELSGKHKTNSGLDFSAGESGLLVVSGKLSGFGSNSLEDIVDEGVHDRHTLLGDTGIGVDLLQNLVNVGRVAFGSLLGLLDGGSGLLGCLLGRFLGWSLGHFVSFCLLIQSMNVGVVRRYTGVAQIKIVSI